MLNKTIIASCLLTAISATASASETDIQADKPYAYENRVSHVIGIEAENATNRYFVQLRSLPTAFVADVPRDTQGNINFQSAEMREERNHIAQEQDQFMDAMTNKLGEMPNVLYRYQTAFNGFSLELTEEQAEKLLEMPQVLKVIRQRKYELHTDVSPNYIGAESAWNQPASANGTGNMGEGVVIGIIDSGINYDHPSFQAVGDDGYTHTNPNGSGVYLGDCLEDASYCNDKLIGVYSYNNLTAGYNGVRPEVGVDYNGHGSHVASTAAGNIINNIPYHNAGSGEVSSGEPIPGTNIAQMSGIAPHANIISFQACSATGGCDAGAMVASVEDAIEAGVDVINMSIGPDGEGQHPWTNAIDMAFLAAQEAGVFVALSAGNSGADPIGSSRVDSTIGHLAPWTTIVANASHDRSFEKEITSDSGTLPMVTGTGGVSEAVTAEVIYADELSGAMPWEQYADCGFPGREDAVPELDGKIVVCDRGENPALFRKAELAALSGAVGVIIRNVPEFDTTTLYSLPYPIPGMQVNEMDGQALVDWIADEKAVGRSPTITMSPGAAVSDSDMANVINVTSSRGPYSNHPALMVPHITAPGSDVYAAYTDEQPFHDNPAPSDYTFLSGTSMASPHIAGAAAVIRGMHPDWTPAEIQSALMMTSNPATRTFDRSGASDLWDRGAGMVQLDRAANAGLVLDVTADEFVAADPENGGDITDLNMAYLLNDNCPGTCSWERTFRATESGTWTFQMDGFNPSLDSFVAEPAMVALEAGETATVTFTATYSTTAADEWIETTMVAVPSHGGETLTLTTRLKPMKAIVPESLTAEYPWQGDGVSFDDFRFREPETVSFTNEPFIKAESYELEALADSDPSDVFDDVNDGVAYFTFDVKQATDVPVEVYLALTDSSDVDLFVGYDDNHDGVPQAVERICISATVGNDEYCRIDNLVSGTYWVLAWNYEGSSESPNSIVVDLVQESPESMFAVNALPVSTAQPYENWPVELLWDGELQEKGHYYGAIDVLTYDFQNGSYTSFGSSDIAIKQRGEAVTADVSSTEVSLGDVSELSFTLAPNPFSQDMTFEIAVQLAEGFSAHSVDGLQSMGSLITVAHTVEPGTNSASTVSIPVEVSGLVHGEVEHTYEVTQDRNDQVITGSLAQFNPNSAPEVTATADEDSVRQGDSLELTAEASDPDGDALSYQWRQVSGVSASLANVNAAEIDVTAPTVENKSTLVFEVTVSDGEFSNSSQVSVDVKPKKSGSSLSTLVLLFLSLLVVGRRVRLRK